MSFIVSAKTYIPAPEGLHQGVCVDVIDRGMVDTEYGKKHKCRIVFEIDKKMADGRPFTASKIYNVNLNEKSTLRKDLQSWRGKQFTTTELQSFLRVDRGHASHGSVR